MSAPLLGVAGLDTGRKGHPLCVGLELVLETGQWWAVLGINGSGKTTLLHTLAGLLPPLAGEIRLQGRRLDTLARREVAQQLGLLPQDSIDPFPATVLETALIGRHPHLGPWRGESADDVRQARESLEEVGLAALAGRSVDTLSGGERRRLAVATLLTQAPRILLLDEPANHLDLHQRGRVLDRIGRRVKSGKAGALMTVHDPSIAARYCDRVLLLYGDGRWEAGPSESLLTASKLEGLYGCPITACETPNGPAFLPA